MLGDIFWLENVGGHFQGANRSIGGYTWPTPPPVFEHFKKFYTAPRKFRLLPRFFPQARGSDEEKTGPGASSGHPERVTAVMFKKIAIFAILVHFWHFLPL